MGLLHCVDAAFLSGYPLCCLISFLIDEVPQSAFSQGVVHKVKV